MLGGNFLSAGPDTRYLQEAMSRLDLSVRIATKLNRSDLVTGRTALILPCLGRTEIDRREWGLKWNQALETGGVLVANKVRMEGEVQFVRQD